LGACESAVASAVTQLRSEFCLTVVAQGPTQTGPIQRASETPLRFVSLDALRGVAALAVVFWHWPNFFFQGTTPGNLDRSHLPLYSVFFAFYEKGWMAVDIFFSLSGFIFFWLYSERVTQRRIGPGEFAVLRFSRLYPLHLITLVIVAALQWNVHERTGSFFVFSLNDAYHFVLNLLFISGWRTSFGDSFNAPVWSVSVEIFLYGLFFALCRLGRPTWPRLGALILIGAFLKFFIPLGRGIFSFYLGGVAYYFYAAIVLRGNARHAVRPIIATAAVGWIVAAIAIKLRYHGATHPMTGAGLEDKAANLAITGVLMPLTILGLALVETVRRNFGRHLSFLGDISYSSYMLHFPMQLAVYSLFAGLGWTTAVFYTPVALLLFFLALIGLSLVSYSYIERPAQRFIRKRWAIAPRALRSQP